MTTLHGDRVVLRPLRDGDDGPLRAIHRTPEVSAWWGLPGDGFPHDTDEGSMRWVIEAGGAVAGLIDANEENEPDYRHAWIDLFVDPARHRRGVASDAIRAVVRHLAEARGHHHVTIDPAVDNHAAIRCYESVGFRRVGIRRADWRDTFTGEWRDALLLDLVVGPGRAPAGGVLTVAERDAALVFTLDDLLRFHGPGSPGGVALAFKVLERALPELAPDAPLQRRELTIRTAFGGPGARDGFEAVTRAVSDGRYVVDEALSRPALGRTRERFVFTLDYRERSVTLVLREGLVTEELIDLARTDPRGEEQERRLDVLKRDLADRVAARPADAVYALEPST